MSVVDRPPKGSELPDRAWSGDAAACVSDLYDQHGVDLFKLAFLVSGDAAAAASAVLEAFQAACAEPAVTGPAWPTRHDLARDTFVACRRSDGITRLEGRDVRPGEATEADLFLDALEMQQRALLGLTLHGDHTYREAAELLDLDSGAAAELLRTTLHALSSATSR